MKKFAKTHEWINTENGEVGITENAIEQLGDIVFLELPEAGNEVISDIIVWKFNNASSLPWLISGW